MSSTRLSPPQDGSVTLPEAVDYHRKQHPTRPMFVFQADGRPDITEVSYLEFARATDRVAHYLRPGRKGPEGQVVGLVALSDTLLYHAVTIGIMRAGMIPYPMSPRNTAVATIKLVKETSCHRLVATRATLRPLMEDLEKELAADPLYALSIEEVPPLFDIFPKLGQEKEEDPFTPYPTAQRPSLKEIAMYLHSSGSTGLPKTIAQTFRAIVHWASFPLISDVRDYKVQLRQAGMALPPFHAMCIITHLLCSLYGMTPIGLFPPTATTPKSQPVHPSPHNILEHAARTKCNALVTVPTFLHFWANEKKAVDFLASLEFVEYGGGALPSKLGNFMTESGVHITPIYGATEFGAPIHLFCPKGYESGWEYIKFSEDINIRWVPQGDGTFESQFLTCDNHEISVENLPDVRGYSSSDLWTPHPTRPGFWKIVGRQDDVIVHTSGEKTVPAPMEDILMSSPYLMGVVMFGRDHDQPGLLVELKGIYAIDVENDAEVIQARDMLWPIVEEANKVAPAFSRIFKEMILFTSSDKPLPRAGKGTVLRKAALKVYEVEIEEIYAKVEATAKVESVVPPASWTKSDTEGWLTAQVEEILPGRKFSASGDLFDQGMDSLGATILRRRIIGAMQSNRALQTAAQRVSQTTVYDNASIAKLAALLDALAADLESESESLSQNSQKAIASTSRSEAMERMIAKYSEGFTQITPVGQPTTAEPIQEAVVLLTGSAGNLGSQLLKSLLRDEKVKRVYSVTRPSKSQTSKERHVKRFMDKGFDVGLLDSEKLVFLEAEVSETQLGVPQEMYEELRDSVNVIIHNAWKLDFNLSLQSFEPYVQGTRNLIDLARSGPHASSLKFLFTSSVSSASSWDTTRGPYPEEIMLDARYAVGHGYGEAKYVCERVLANSGLQTTSFRIGQISGGGWNGAWATSDWVPILVKSSIHLGSLPSAIGFASWLPTDAVSQTILDAASSDTQSAALNVVHPKPVTWNDIVGAVNDVLVDEGVIPEKLPVVDMKTWFCLLEAKAHQADAKEIIYDIPAIKLLEFFRSVAQADASLRQEGDPNVESCGLTPLSTMKAQEVSRAMREVSPLGRADAELWVKYWKNAGLFL
ncbi:unnamed protein product [Cyclocybe aegerita]|uniref:Acetyl-CoA synthetase-like protein n=1 Tax=Cyclocybe aegerita TaxID=1973307 RepID=A0A8S0X2W6_CYCAE|nr:unnamed protein product [Cyclocybe aegerita]